MEETSEAKHGSAHGRSMWTTEEDRLIREGVCRFGLRWRQIAITYMPSRSDSSIRNRWMRIEKEKTERLRDGNEVLSDGNEVLQSAALAMRQAALLHQVHNSTAPRASSPPTSAWVATQL